MTRSTLKEFEVAVVEYFPEEVRERVYAHMAREGIDRHSPEAGALWRDVLEDAKNAQKGYWAKGENAANAWLRFMFPFGHVSPDFAKQSTNYVGMLALVRALEGGLENPEEVSGDWLMQEVVTSLDGLAAELDGDPPILLHDLEGKVQSVAVNSIMSFFDSLL